MIPARIIPAHIYWPPPLSQDYGSDYTKTSDERNARLQEGGTWGDYFEAKFIEGLYSDGPNMRGRVNVWA